MGEFEDLFGALRSAKEAGVQDEIMRASWALALCDLTRYLEECQGYTRDLDTMERFVHDATALRLARVYAWAEDMIAGADQGRDSYYTITRPMLLRWSQGEEIRHTDATRIMNMCPALRWDDSGRNGGYGVLSQDIQDQLWLALERNPPPH